MSATERPGEAGLMTGDKVPAWQRHRAARTVAGLARDAGDLAELLDMLGLTAADGLEEPVEPPPKAPRKRVPHLEPQTACRLGELLRQSATPR